MSSSSRKTLPALCATLLAVAAALAGTQSDAARPFDPFTDHDRLPPDLTWVVQLEHPARQFASTQTRILEDAIADTELFARSMKSWSRLTGVLSPGDAADDVLGRRAQFIARTGDDATPWAVCVELGPDRRKALLERLRALPRDLRHQRYVYELEDGRFILAEFVHEGAALVVLAPRSDRKLAPERDPQSALFFELFDRLAGHAVPEAEACPLAPVLHELAPAEILVAHQSNGRGAPADDGTEEPDVEARPRTIALALDRAPGGWSGSLVLSDTGRQHSSGISFDPASLDRALPAATTLARFLYPESAVPLISAATPLPAATPALSDSQTLVGVLARAPGQLDYLQLSIVPDEGGPARYDGALAQLQSPEGVALPNHDGLFPEAIRQQTARMPGALAQDFTLLWGFSPPTDGRRLAAMLITPRTDRPDRAGRATLAGILDAVTLLEHGSASPPVSAGSLRPSELTPYTDALLPPDSPLHTLPGVIKSVSWSLRPDTLDARPVLRGPVELLVVPAPQAQLGNP